MIQKATVKVGDMIGGNTIQFNFGVVIDQKPDDFLNEVEFGNFLVLTDAGKQEWFSFDYVYCMCDLLSREDKK